MLSDWKNQITSNNPSKAIQFLQDARSHSQYAVVEGLHALRHAVTFGADVVALATHDKTRTRYLTDVMAQAVSDYVNQIAEFEMGHYEQMTPTPTKPITIAVVRKREYDIQDMLEKKAPLVVLENPNHLHNIGAVIRLTAGLGGAGVLILADHDPWHPVVISASAGLIFAVPVLRSKALPNLRRTLIGFAMDGESIHTADAEGRQPVALVFGSERYGLSDNMIKSCNKIVTIPMQAGVSSLNLATSAAIGLYEYKA